MKLILTLLTIFLSSQLFASAQRPREEAATGPFRRHHIERYGQTALGYAAAHGSLKAIEELLRAEPQSLTINEQDHFGHTALILAVINNHPEVLTALIKAGADIEIMTSYGYTPLMTAAITGHVICAEILIRAGAHLKTQNERGQTALSLARYNSHDTIVGIILVALMHEPRPRRQALKIAEDCIAASYEDTSHDSEEDINWRMKFFPFTIFSWFNS